VAFALLVVSVFAAVARLPAQRLPFTRFAAEEGLLASQVWDVHQDRRGLIWVATTWGFSRFDGESFTAFSVAEGLRSPSGRTVLEDLEGNLWFGNNSGVSRFDGRTILSFAEREGAPRGTVWAAVVDAGARLWFGSEDGLSRYQNGEFRRFGTADGLADDYVYSLLAASDGSLWVGSRGAGVTRCELDPDGDLRDCRVLDRGTGLGSDVVRALIEDREGRILIGTRGGGLAIWDEGLAESLRAVDGLPSDDIYALLERADGTLVVGTADHGMAICLEPAPGRCRTLRKSNGLPENGVRALHEDREGSLWIGTEGGLALLVREDLWSLSVADGLPNRNVYAIARGDDSDLWLGTFDGLANVVLGYHGQPSVESPGSSAGLPAKWIWTLLNDLRGSIWIGTNSGLCRLRAGRCTNFDESDGLPSSFVLSLARGADGSIWIGTTGGIARLRLDPTGRVSALERFSAADGLENPRAYAIVADGEGRVWFAQGDRLTVLEEGRFRRLGAADGIAWEAVRGLGIDRQGRVLVGGWGRLARAERDASGAEVMRVWDRSSGLGDQMVLTLGEDADGHLLLGTSRGIVVLDPEAADGVGAVTARIDASTGAVATEISHSAAYAVDGEGRHWFGFMGGVTGVLGELAEEPAAPTVSFSRLESERGRIFLAPFSGLERGPVGWLGGAPPEMPHGENNVRVWVRSATYSNRTDLAYQFRLEDGQSDWSDPHPEPFRDLMNLPPGDHRVLVRTANVDGPWSEPASLEFRIDPAWWQAAAFPWALGGLVLTLVVVGFGWRARRVRALKNELDRRIAERTDDLARYAAALSGHLQTVDRASDRARQAEKTRRELFARASHELRTPLTAVLGFSELLERSLAERLEEKERRYLANVRESAELLLRQINELLEHLKLESGRVEIHLDEIALGSMVESVASLMEGFALHRGVRLELRLEEDLPTVRVDVAKLRQVLMNLISNAVKFSPSGETVQIAVGRPELEVDEEQKESYQITISDRGPGIPAAEVETIFEPYRRLSGPAVTTPGTGLGLPIARQFVELLGGSIAVDTEPGRGASFRVVLPVEPDPDVPLFDSVDSGGFEPQRTQVLVFDPQRDRFSALVAGLGEEEVLAVRVDVLDALRRMLASLRPRAVVAPFDPAADSGWRDVAPILGALSEHQQPFVLVAVVGSRALGLPMAGVLTPDAPEEQVRRALRRAGVSARRSGRRPLVLIAGTREAGLEIGADLSGAGCDHFRVEGADAVRAAFREAVPDAVATDVAHAISLAPEIARRHQIAEERQIGWILFEAGEPEPESLLRLAELVLAEGEEVERALGSALAHLLEHDAASSGLP
jgi:signal transduction histidine kinase/ligand-binding sensor domain-containing protein